MEGSNNNDRGNDGLRDPEHDGESKEHPAAPTIAHGFRARDKCDDRVIETENADLAENVSSRPGDREYAERGRSKQSSDKKGEDAAEV